MVTSLISSAGFGAYMALTTIMHAVMTTLLGITLPFAAYMTATSALSFFLGPVGVALMVLAVLTVTGTRGQKRLDHFVLAYAVTQAHIAAGPEVELVIDPEERARHERMAAEIAYLQSELAAAEQLLAEAAEKETKFNELRRLKAELQAERAGLAGKEGAEERIQQLTARIEAVERELARERRQRQAAQENVERLQALLEERVRERADELQRRFAITYEGKFIVDDYVARWLARMPNIERRYKAERAMLRLSDGEWRYLRDNPRIKTIKTLIWEAGFDKTGRLYFLRESNVLRFVRIGDKNSQAADLRWLQSKFG